MIACAMLGATAAQAQAQSEQLPERRLQLGVSAQGVYDSNISHTSRELAERRGLSVDDFRFTPAVTIDALLPIGRQSLSVLGSLGYDIYARNSRLDSERVSLDAAAGLRIASCDATLTANYARRQSELGDLFFIGDVSEALTRRIKNKEDIKALGLSAACGDNIGLRPTASVQQTWVDNSSGLRRIADYNQTTFTGGVAYAQPSFGLLTLFGTYSTTEFPNRSAFAGLSGDDGFKSRGGGIRFERAIGARLSGLVEVSYTSTDSDRAVSDFSGITYRGAITQEIGSRMQLTLDVSRAVLPSNRVDANYSVEKLYSANLDYALSERAVLYVTGVARDRNYRGGFLVFGPSLVNDHLRSGTVGARYSMGRGINLTLSGTRESRSANGTIFDYKSTRVAAGVSKTF